VERRKEEEKKPMCGHLKKKWSWKVYKNLQSTLDITYLMVGYFFIQGGY